MGAEPPQNPEQQVTSFWNYCNAMRQPKAFGDEFMIAAAAMDYKAQICVLKRQDDGSVLPTGTNAQLNQHLAGKDVLAFGVDPEDDTMAGPSAGWSAQPHHPAWAGLERDLRATINAGDQSWSAAECRKAARYAWDRHAVGIIPIDRKAEASRDAYGRRLELDTLLTESEWTYGTTKDSLWLPLPDGRDKLERATPFLWFLRMSEQQIFEGNFYWSKVARS